MANEDNGYQSASSRASSPDRTRPFAKWDSDNTGQVEDNMVNGPSRKKAPRRSQVNTGAVGNQAGKIRHLKKEDGEPLWRKDIQYDFLRAIFDNDKKVFTNSYELDKFDQKLTFAELYIDTMARSSKTSKVLRDKLLSDHEAAKSMAMVCLLVNVGRMNTTLNFFPEMRAQLRTYHAIPSLQAHQDATAYKQLQDAPRLKSILKGAAEDRPEPNTITDFKVREVPRTNPVNLIFLICQQASQVAELHFPHDGEFHDLIMKTNYSSHSRANAFLWLMWMYLESDFTEEGCEENPFGPGVDYGTDVANQGVPKLSPLSPEEEAQENIDPQMEVDFGREKQSHRAKIIAADQAFEKDQPAKRGTRNKFMPDEGPTSAAILPRIRPSKHESDLDSTRSTPPPRALARLGAASTGRRGVVPLKYQIFDASSPAGPSPHIHDGIMPRKPRPPTAHQLAVERSRNERVEYILDRGLRKENHKARKLRRQEGSTIRAKRRLDAMIDPFIDSDDEDYAAYGLQNNVSAMLFRDVGFGGLCQLTSEVDDFGEEFSSHAASLRRAGRRLARWDVRGTGLGVVQPIKKRVHQSYDDTPEPRGGDFRSESRGDRASSVRSTNGHGNGDVNMEDPEDLDDVDKELLGIGDEDGNDDDEELDDVDKTLLGMAGDDTDGSD